MDEHIVQTNYDAIDWDGVEKEVIEKLKYLRASWKCSEEQLDPEAHKKMCVDLYLPIIERLASFCAALKIEDDAPAKES